MTKRILLCDDEVHILRAAEIKFSHAGYEVRCASDGEEAWRILKSWRPDVMLTDCQMPRLDGIGLIARMRTNPDTAEIPVIMLTAKGYEIPVEDLREGMRVLEVIPKPFSPRAVLRQVEALLEGELVS